MASTTTSKTRTTRTRKPKAVETPVETPEAGTDLAVVETPDAPAVETPEADPKLVKRLADLTEEAKTALQAEAAADALATEAFYTAAAALREIRDGDGTTDLVTLCGITHPETGAALNFDTYVEVTFGKSRDLGDKWARAASVIDRLKQELSADEIEQYGLPTTEAQARPMGYALKADPDSEKKLTSDIWKESKGVAENRVKDAAEKKGTGFIPAAVVPTIRDVAKARDIVDPKPERKPAPKPKLGADADPLAKTLLKLAKQFIPNGVHFDQFIEILIEGTKLDADPKDIKAQGEIARRCV